MSSSVDVDNSEGDDISIKKLLSVSDRHRGESWVLDSGVTYHKCPHKNSFVDYRPMRGTVYLGDGDISSVDGIVSIILRMFDRVIRNIQYWHVPGISKSLISLSTLDLQGYLDL